MTDIADIEEHVVLESPFIKEIFPNVPEIEQEVDDLLDKRNQMPETSQQEADLLVEPDSTTGLLIPAEVNIEKYYNNNDVTTNSDPHTNETTLKRHSDKECNATYTANDSDEKLSIESKNKTYEVIKADSTIALHVPDKHCNNKILLKAQYRNSHVTKETRCFLSSAQNRINNIKKIALKNWHQKIKDDLNKKVINDVNDIIDAQDTRVNKNDIQRLHHISNKEMYKIMNVTVSIRDVKAVLKECHSYCVECKRLFFVKNDFLKHRNKEHKNIKVNWIKKTESSKKEVPVNSIVSCTSLRKDEVSKLQYDDGKNTSLNSYKTSILKKTPKRGQDVTASVMPNAKDAVRRKRKQLVKTDYDKKQKNSKSDMIEHSIKYMNDLFTNESTDSDKEIARNLRRIEREIKYFALMDYAFGNQNDAIPNTSSAIDKSSVPINATEKSHYERSTKEMQKICLHCNKNFACEENLIKHMHKILTSNLNLKCNVCIKRFPSRLCFILHCKSESHYKKFQEQNIKQFKIKRNFDKIDTPFLLSYYQCRKCAKFFTQKTLLYEHWTNGLCKAIKTITKKVHKQAINISCQKNLEIHFRKPCRWTKYARSENKLIRDHTDEQKNKNGTKSIVIENPEEEIVPTNGVDLNYFAEEMADGNAKEEIKFSVILDSSDDEESDLPGAKFDKNVAKITGNDQDALEIDLVPNSVIFKCQNCPLHFVKCKAAYEHFKRCAVTDEKTLDCKQCYKTLVERDMLLHEKQHITAKDLEVITVKDDSVFQRLLFYCSKCGVNFDENNFYEHNCDIGREDLIYCAICDAILDPDLKDHSMWHSKFGTDEFTVVCFGNPNEMFWKNNHRVGENSESQVLGYFLKHE